MTTFNTMQLVKRRFFAMRNGAIADSLRRLGAPYRIIFGLNLPQITEIAAEFPHTPDLARALWANKTTRESMLLAPMLFPPEAMTPDEAARWIQEAPTPEIIDVLCLKLLRRLPFATDLIDAFALSAIDLHRYAALRLTFNRLADNPARALDLALNEAQRKCPMTASLARMLAEEASLLTDA